MRSEKFYWYVIKAMEEMLKMYMGEDAYKEFSNKVAKEGFRLEVEDMADGDFKQFVLDNFDTITAEDGPIDCPWK